MPSTPKTIIEHLASEAGITINGDRPWDIQVHNEKLYGRVLNQGSLGLGESYMDGWWDCERLDQFIYRLLSSHIQDKIEINWELISQYLQELIFNRQSTSRAYNAGKMAYDVTIDAYSHSLDKRQAYSCGYWKNASNLDDAQEAKLELICKKIGLKPGMTVLDIGCGVGSFIKYAAQKHKVKAVGVTISKEQAQLGRELCKGLPVEIRLQDYRSIKGKFDHIISVGMFEHVGFKNYKTFMAVVHRSLKDDGLFLLHTIGWNKSQNTVDPWIDKYIFPNGILPSIKQISGAVEGLFVIEDLHNFGADYDKTLMAWSKNFEKNWPKIKSKYDERFYRMWRYYLLSCAGLFRSRNAQLWQIVFSKKGLPQGYTSVR